MGYRRNHPETLTYHVMARGNNKQSIFNDDADRHRFLRLLEQSTAHREWVGLGYCLMGNHVHLLLETPKVNISEGMRDLLSLYARRFNRRHGRTGHLFSERFKTVPVESDPQLQMTVRYIAQNPVRAGLVERPVEWRWNSVTHILSGDVPRGGVAVDRVLDLFHPIPKRARCRLEELVNLRVDPDRRVSAATLVQVFGAWDGIRVAAEAGWTKTEIADALGLHRSTISRRLAAAGWDEAVDARSPMAPQAGVAEMRHDLAA